MIELSVRAALPEDVEAIGEVHHLASATGYAHIFAEARPARTLSRTWQRRLLDRDTSVFVAEAPESDVGGVVALRTSAELPMPELFGLYVLPRLWSSGVGSALHDHVLGLAARLGPTIGLWVLEENARGRRFYEHRGWRLDPSQTLTNPGGAVEARYIRDLRGR